MPHNHRMKTDLERFKEMTLEARLDYLFLWSQKPKPRNLVYKDGVLIGELEPTGEVGEYKVVEFPKWVEGKITL